MAFGTGIVGITGLVLGKCNPHLLYFCVHARVVGEMADTDQGLLIAVLVVNAGAVVLLAFLMWFSYRRRYQDQTTEDGVF